MSDENKELPVATENVNTATSISSELFVKATSQKVSRTTLLNHTIKDISVSVNEEKPNFGDTLYNQINDVIGGNNKEQFLTMTIPGTIIEPLNFSYDVKKNEPKPALVMANESKLVNKLFDASFLTGSDNGRQLSTQYRTALNVLSPKLNPYLYDAKIKLRQLLMTPYPYSFDSHTVNIMTLEQVFYRLYDEYVTAKQAWSKMQIDKKYEIEKKYPNNNEQSYKNRQNAYLEWYTIVADAEILKVDEKFGKILNVFSPGDMDIINGVLDSGVTLHLHQLIC